MLGLKSLVDILKIHPTHTHAHPSTPTHTRAHLHTPAHIPTHIPAHSLNLINHMKLGLIQKWQIDRKKEKRRNKSPLKTKEL